MVAARVENLWRHVLRGAAHRLQLVVFGYDLAKAEIDDLQFSYVPRLVEHQIFQLEVPVNNVVVVHVLDPLRNLMQDNGALNFGASLVLLQVIQKDFAPEKLEHDKDGLFRCTPGNQLRARVMSDLQPIGAAQRSARVGFVAELRSGQNAQIYARGTREQSPPHSLRKVSRTHHTQRPQFSLHHHLSRRVGGDVDDLFSRWEMGTHHPRTVRAAEKDACQGRVPLMRHAADASRSAAWNPNRKRKREGIAHLHGHIFVRRPVVRSTNNRVRLSVHDLPQFEAREKARFRDCARGRHVQRAPSSSSSLSVAWQARLTASPGLERNISPSPANARNQLTSTGGRRVIA